MLDAKKRISLQVAWRAFPFILNYTFAKVISICGKFMMQLIAKLLRFFLWFQSLNQI